MKTIWKYSLTPGNKSFFVPVGGIIRHVDEQFGNICLWSDVIFMIINFMLVLIMLAAIGLKIDNMESKIDAANNARLVCWYYDICHDDHDNPKHEVWTDKGRAKLHEWAKAAARDVPADMLPEDVREWAVK